VIDWSRSAVEIDRRIRAFNPWPVAETRLDGEQLRIFAADVAKDEVGEGPEGPGTISAIRDDGIVVQCGVGRLALKQLQRPGRRVVTAAEFAHAAALKGRRLG
jgi:methionyl-tRNA formyltransferase